jgi:hypothetical protein
MSRRTVGFVNFLLNYPSGKKMTLLLVQRILPAVLRKEFVWKRVMIFALSYKISSSSFISSRSVNWQRTDSTNKDDAGKPGCYICVTEHPVRTLLHADCPRFQFLLFQRDNTSILSSKTRAVVNKSLILCRWQFKSLVAFPNKITLLLATFASPHTRSLHSVYLTESTDSSYKVWPDQFRMLFPMQKQFVHKESLQY